MTYLDADGIEHTATVSAQTLYEAAAALLREYLPSVRVRFVNVVDLFRLVPNIEHPHGMTDREFEAIFTPDKPVIFNFHSYPWLIHRLTYRRQPLLPSQALPWLGENTGGCGYSPFPHAAGDLKGDTRVKRIRVAVAALDECLRCERIFDNAAIPFKLIIQADSHPDCR